MQDMESVECTFSPLQKQRSAIAREPLTNAGRLYCANNGTQYPRCHGSQPFIFLYRLFPYQIRVFLSRTWQPVLYLLLGKHRIIRAAAPKSAWIAMSDGLSGRL